MPSDYWKKALTMKVGEIDGPVRSYKGYHIIKVNAIRDPERSLDDPKVRDKVKSSIARVYRDTLQAISLAYLDNIHKQFKTEYNKATVKLLLRKMGDKSAPKNMNLFSSFTPDERKKVVVVRGRMGKGG